MKHYQSITFGKRQPLFEKLLDEIEVSFEGQSGKLGELQQFDVQRRRISDDFHTHLNESRSNISHSKKRKSEKSRNRTQKTNPEFDMCFVTMENKLNFNAYESKRNAVEGIQIWSCGISTEP